MTTPVTGVRIPPHLLAQIDALAVGGKSKTEIILSLIQIGLGEESPDVESDGMAEIRASLDVLNDRLTAVERRSTTKPREDVLEGISNEAAGCLALGVSERQLARRFGIDRTGINHNRSNPEKLAVYTRTRDPEGIAWEFRDGRYFPVSG